LLRTVTIQNIPSGVDTDFRALAVDATGNIYVATWGSKVIKLDTNGVYQKHLAITGTPALYGLTDLAVDATGDVIIGSGGGAGVAVTLVLSGTTVQTTTTDANGNYSFTVTGLSSNSSSYWVEIGIPSGYTIAPLDQGMDDTKDNDFYTGGSGAWTNYITVGPGITNTTVD